MKHETKFFLVQLVICYFLFAIFSSSQATDFSSSNYTVKDPIVSSGTAISASSNFGLGQSLSQTAIGKSTSSSFQLWSGFQYFFKVSANTLTPTAGAGQVSLSWTAPTTYLGVAVGNYEVGVGTVSGSYTFEDAGNVTSFTKTGLTNGTTYYFIVKAETSSGTFLVYSNEVSAAPVGAAVENVIIGSGGGGVLPPGATMIVKGQTFPGAIVTVLKNGMASGASVANAQGSFSISLSGIGGGTHTFGVYAVDKDGFKTAAYAFSRNLVSGVSATEEVFLSPTLKLSHTEIKQEETLELSGFAAPFAAVKIVLDESFLTSAAANSDGVWRLSLLTKDLKLMNHTITVTAALGNKQSNSIFQNFLVGEKSVPFSQVCKRADFNCDGHIDLVDFSIFLYYWFAPPGFSTALADFDNSGLVDMADVSILFYEWTG